MVSANKGQENYKKTWKDTKILVSSRMPGTSIINSKKELEKIEAWKSNS